MKLFFMILVLFVMSNQAEANRYSEYKNSYMTGNTSKPAKWCGWFMRQLHGGGPEYNLARNWVKRGKPSGPRVGAIVVWPHHVGKITGKTTKGWIVKSGNDGGRVRERVRSVSKAIAFRIL